MFLEQCLHEFSSTSTLPLSLFLAGLVGGATHCAFMCAPFVLAQTGKEQKLKKLHSFLLLPYHAGRMTTYILLAVAVSSLLNLAFLFSDLKVFLTAPLLFLAGITFLVSAFPRLGVLFPWIMSIRISGTYRFVSRISQNLLYAQNVVQRYILGLVLGLLPCGLVISAIMAASAAPTPLDAAFAMGAFALGTMPALMLVSFGGQALANSYPKHLQYFRRGAMSLSAVFLFFIAGKMIL